MACIRSKFASSSSC